MYSISASLNAPPECSRKAPIITPRTMTTPILPRVIPNPSLIDFTTISSSIPESKPKKSAAPSSAKKGCTFNFAVSNTIITTLIRSNKVSSRPCALQVLILALPNAVFGLEHQGQYSRLFAQGLKHRLLTIPEKHAK